MHTGFCERTFVFFRELRTTVPLGLGASVGTDQAAVLGTIGFPSDLVGRMGGTWSKLLGIRPLCIHQAASVVCSVCPATVIAIAGYIMAWWLLCLTFGTYGTAVSFWFCTMSLAIP